jgi:hypothetical protein
MLRRIAINLRRNGTVRALPVNLEMLAEVVVLK